MGIMRRVHIWSSRNQPEPSVRWNYWVTNGCRVPGWRHRFLQPGEQRSQTAPNPSPWWRGWRACTSPSQTWTRCANSECGLTCTTFTHANVEPTSFRIEETCHGRGSPRDLGESPQRIPQPKVDFERVVYAWPKNQTQGLLVGVISIIVGSSS